METSSLLEQQSRKLRESVKIDRKESKIDLYNEALAGLAVPSKSLISYRKSKRGDFAIRSFRNDMAKAERMKLSKNFVEHAVALSFSYPKYFAKLIERAIPAFDTLWIEWDELKRFDCIQDNFDKIGIPKDDHRDSVANRLGYLICNRGGYFEYSLVMCESTPNGNGSKNLMGPMVSWIFSNNLDEPVSSLDTQFGRESKELDPDQKHENRTRANFFGSLMGRAYLNAHENSVDEFVDWIPNLYVEPHAFFASQDLEKVIAEPQQISKLLDLACHAVEGDMRFLIAVFSLLNYPRFVREIATPKKVSAVRWGRPVPRSEVKLIEIELPKRGVIVYDQLFTGHGTPKRQHVRRGHWRVRKDEFGRIKDRRWINPMVCGDAKLGVIDHEYVLKVKKDKKND